MSLLKDYAAAYRQWYERQREDAPSERLAMADVETQRAAVEITGEVHAYTMHGNAEGKTSLPLDYVPTTFEEDAAMWDRINMEMRNGQ